MQALTKFSHRIDDADTCEVLPRSQHGCYGIFPDEARYSFTVPYRNNMMPFPVTITYPDLFLVCKAEFIYFKKLGYRELGKVFLCPIGFPRLLPGGFFCERTGHFIFTPLKKSVVMARFNP